MCLQTSWSMGLRRPAPGESGCRASRFEYRPTGLDPDALAGFPPPARALRGTALLLPEFGPVPLGRPPAEGAEPRHDVRTIRRPGAAESGLHRGRSGLASLLGNTASAARSDRAAGLRRSTRSTPGKIRALTTPFPAGPMHLPTWVYAAPQLEPTRLRL